MDRFDLLKLVHMPSKYSMYPVRIFIVVKVPLFDCFNELCKGCFWWKAWLLCHRTNSLFYEVFI